MEISDENRNSMPLTAKTDQDFPCIECGYSLFGLDGDQLCPECGIPVKNSLRADLLYFSDIKWLIAIRWGLLVLLCNIPIQLLVYFSRYFQVTWGGSPVRLGFVQLIAVTVNLAAILLITRKEIVDGFGEDRPVNRWVLRLTGFFVLLASFVAILSGFLPSISALAITVANTVFLCGLLLYLNRLGTRMPSPTLEKLAWTLVWAVALSHLIFRIVLQELYMRSGEMHVSLGLFYLGEIILAIVGLFYVICLVSYYRAIGRIVRKRAGRA